MGGIFIRKVELRMNELEKYTVIKNLVDNNGNKKQAALKLQLSTRQINRLIKGYQEYGKSFFVHGNRGSKPVNAISEETKKNIILLYNTKYYGANFTHFTELLDRFENITLSVSAVSSILESQYIFSPRITKNKKKRIKKELIQKKETTSLQKEKINIQNNLIELENAHSRRPRCAYFGELLQMDASLHLWYGVKKTTLHIAVDDHTGMIVGAWFDDEETLNGYYHVLHQILTKYGIPFKFFTDCRTIFTYTKKNSKLAEEDTFTQFAYACHQLGTELECSSIPQAKGRVERFFETLQSRLPIEMRLRGVTTTHEANEFLNSYIKEFNAKFALQYDNTKSVFVQQPSNDKINLILAVLTQRTVDCGHCIQFRNKNYRMLDKNGNQVHYRRGTKVMVIQTYDSQMFCSVNDSYVYALEEIPVHKSKSKEFDLDYEPSKPKKRYIPPMTHPWRQQRFNDFAKRQPQYSGYTGT